MAKAKTVYVVLATSVEKPTPKPYVVGVYETVQAARHAQKRHEADVLAVTAVEEATYLPGPRPKPPANKKGR